MDLGFGAANQAVGAAASSALLQAAEAQERLVEDEINRYGSMLDDAEALEGLRARRLAELRGQHQRDRERRALGHGAYEDLGSTNTIDVAKAFFDAARQSPRLVVHFHRPATRYCDVFHKHLAALAERHLETRFVSINVENCESVSAGGAAFLVERLGIVVMPTVLIVKDRQSVHQLRGFDELGSTPDFSTSLLENVLGKYGAVDCNDMDAPMGEEEEEKRSSGDSPRGVRAITRAARYPSKGYRTAKYEEDEAS